jgi:hypothetical protein
MKITEYIESGNLELFVAGKLTDSEMKKVALDILNEPLLMQEVIKIEKTIISLSESFSPELPSSFLTLLLKKIATPLSKPKYIKIKRLYRVAVAAVIVLASLLTWTIRENSRIKTEISETKAKNDSTQSKNNKVLEQLAQKIELLNQLRNPALIIENLGGQGTFNKSYAKVYWNKKDQTIFVDAMGLPEPPTDQEYQVWSLALNPLTPTSIGLLSDFNHNEERIFSLENQNESEAFGISLEPKGGSLSPTMEKLYVLGIITID